MESKKRLENKLKPCWSKYEFIYCELVFIIKLQNSKSNLPQYNLKGGEGGAKIPGFVYRTWEAFKRVCARCSETVCEIIIASKGVVYRSEKGETETESVLATWKYLNLKKSAKQLSM